MKTEKEICKEALDVQDACNLSGIVHSWSRNITDLRACLEARGAGGTDAVNNHPANKLFACKVHDLTGMGLSDVGEFNRAYAACEDIVNG